MGPTLIVSASQREKRSGWKCLWKVMRSGDRVWRTCVWWWNCTNCLLPPILFPSVNHTVGVSSNFRKQNSQFTKKKKCDELHNLVISAADDKGRERNFLTDKSEAANWNIKLLPGNPAPRVMDCEKFNLPNKRKVARSARFFPEALVF